MFGRDRLTRKKYLGKIAAKNEQQTNINQMKEQYGFRQKKTQKQKSKCIIFFLNWH